MKKKLKRGFLVALLIGFDEKEIHMWKVYSHSLRVYKTIKLIRKWKYLDDKQIYNLLEELVNIIRLVIRDGLKSILLASSQKKDYSTIFLDHINKHHQWLVRSKGYNRVSFGEIVGTANTLESANFLISQEKSLHIIHETTSDEINLLVKQLEKIINIGDPNRLLLYNLEDIEAFIYEGGKKDKTAAEKLDFLIVTEDFINNHKNKHRIHRLIQIANNKGIITKTISIENPAVNRFNQFGGILAFKKTS
ncbi:MAG: hypothetical protein CEE42_15870 [Promethearchaeota archaeon Loki_b31]|nr:MAG: hypothetical protein CEE42_15870 [Candidatus Lokiarchaeota archaeon Loki_b31]